MDATTFTTALVSIALVQTHHLTFYTVATELNPQSITQLAAFERPYPIDIKQTNSTLLLYTKQFKSRLGCFRMCSKLPECHSVNTKVDGKEMVLCELLSSALESADTLNTETAWEYYRKPLAPSSSPSCRQCPKREPIRSHTHQPTFAISADGNVWQTKQLLREKVLAGASIVIVVKSMDPQATHRFIPETTHVSSSDGEITFKMPLDVVYNRARRMLEASYMSIKTTGTIEETLVPLGNAISPATTGNPHSGCDIIFQALDTQCDNGLAKLNTGEDGSSCLAQYVSQGVRLLVRTTEDEDTRISLVESTVLSSTSNSLLAALSPEYDLSLSSANAFAPFVNRSVRMLNWVGLEEIWTNEQMGSYGNLMTMQLSEPPTWYPDTYWEEIYSVNDQGEVLTADVTPNTVYRAASQGYRMNVAVLHEPSPEVTAWQTFQADTVRCDTTTEICEAYVISQFNPTQPYTIDDSTRQGIKVWKNKVETTTLTDTVSRATTEHAVKWYREQARVQRVFMYSSATGHNETTNLLKEAITSGLPLTLIRTDTKGLFVHHIQHASANSEHVYQLKTRLAMVRTGRSATHGSCSYSRGPQYIITAIIDTVVTLYFRSWTHDLGRACHLSDRLEFTTVEIYATF